MKVKITTKENMHYYDCKKGTIVDVDLEDYVTCVVASEIGNAELEACKALAVAARTFAVSRGVLTGRVISDDASVAQAYRAGRINYSVAKMAAKQTMGQVLTYNGKLISAVYSESNGGRTYSSKEVWGADHPYLIAQPDPWDKKIKNGHGVGMSQQGAITAASYNKSYKDILNFYYPGTKLVISRPVVFAYIKEVINKIMAKL